MSRDYSKIEEEISIKVFFSEYLPPCFKISKDFFSTIPNEQCDLIKPFCFTMSRFNNNESRRNIFIPEFGAYLVLENFIRKNNIIKEIVEFCETENESFSYILGDDDTIICHEQSYDRTNSNNSNYIDNIVEKIIRSAGAKKILKLDISNCFSSLYIHMIPAIFLGYEKTEDEYKKFCENRNNPSIDSTYLKYKNLDKIVRKQNLNQTNGLLTGTQYSKIISEGILTRIDKELKTKNIRFSRYVDDYEVYLYEDNEKTEIIEFPYYISKNLEKIFNDSSNKKLENSELMNLFNTFFELEKEGVKGAIRYLLKSIETKPINANNPMLYKSYLLTIIKNNERSLTKACLLLIENKNTMKLDSTEIEMIENLIGFYIQTNRDLEVIWLVYLLIETNNIIDCTKIINLIVESDNELAQMLLFRKSFLDEIQIRKITEKCISWISLYELYAQNIIDEDNFIKKLSLNKNIKMYKNLKNRGLHFIY